MVCPSAAFTSSPSIRSEIFFCGNVQLLAVEGLLKPATADPSSA
jgi:hypothetical protein